MKKRIQIDSAILSFVIILTGILYLFPHFYTRCLFWDHTFNFLGLLLVFKGTFLRMAARGFKKTHSSQSKNLVSQGPYTLTRNPMYLGSFFIGAGFVLIVWPFWLLPVFALLFYARFNKQVVQEEKFLAEKFGDAYQQYCRRVPRLFPQWKKILETDVRETFPWKTSWTTKEVRGLVGWPILAVILEALQQKIVFARVDFRGIIIIFMFSTLVFFIGLILRYTLFPTITGHAKNSKKI